jgi:hypothetical protein
MSRYHTASGALRRAALPELGNPRTEAIIEGWPIGRQRCRAWFAVETGPRGERASRRTENRDRTGWNAPKLTTYALRTRIADGDDGRTYIVRDVGSHINVLQGDMQHDAGNAFPGDPQHAALLSLFGPPASAAVTACRHGGFLTEETCATCRAEAEERAEHAPHAAEPEYAGLDAVDLEAERLGRGMGPSKSFVRPPAVHRRTRTPSAAVAPAPHTPKKYRCRRCGYVAEQTTNHYGPTWSWGHVNACPECPPWAKYPEFGGCTVWDCVDKPDSGKLGLPGGNDMDQRVAGIARRIAGRRTGVNINEERWIRQHSDPVTPDEAYDARLAEDDEAYDAYLAENAASYKDFARRNGYGHMEFVTWKSSAGDWRFGDWLFIVSRDGQRWRTLLQKSNFPRRGVSHILGDEEYEGTAEGIVEMLRDAAAHEGFGPSPRR